MVRVGDKKFIIDSDEFFYNPRFCNQIILKKIIKEYNDMKENVSNIDYIILLHLFYFCSFYLFSSSFRISCCLFALNNLQLNQCNKKNTEMSETSNFLKSIFQNCESLQSQTLSEAMTINNKKSSDIRKEYYASRLETPLSQKIQHLNSTLKSLSSTSFKRNNNPSKNKQSNCKILLPFKSRNHKKAKELIKILSSSRRNIRQGKSKQKIVPHNLFEDQLTPFAMITEVSQTFDSKQKHNYSATSHKHDKLYRNLTESSEVTQQMIRKITERPKLVRPESSNHQNKVNFRQVLKNNNVIKKMAYYNETYKEYEKKRSCIRPYIPPSNITAQAYSIYERAEKFGDWRFSASLKCKISREIASLTKIMTTIVVLDTLVLCNIDKYAEEIMITKQATKITGTTAHLQPGQIYTVQQLLFGLMLPSGNDASLALALWAGEKLFHFQKKVKKLSGKASHRTKTTISQQSTMTTSFPTSQNYYNRFIEEMNTKAQSLKMLKTKFSNPHGLADPNNKSCCYDLTILCDYAMKNDFFRILVSTQEYRCRVLNTSLQAFKEICWKNTHELLLSKPMEYIGVKTGFTCNAGSCLISCINIEGKEYIFVVLGSISQHMRFRDTESLKQWLLRQQKRAVDQKRDATVRQLFHSKGQS